MSSSARMKSTAGGDTLNTPLTAAATLYVPDDTNMVYLEGTDTVTALVADPRTRNRIVVFVQSDSGTTTFTNTNNPTATDLMDLGGSNVALAQTDALILLLKSDGTWLRLSAADN